MIDSNKSAVQLLEELRKERGELDSLIQALEKRLGISVTTQVSEIDNPQISSRQQFSIDDIPVGFFHNLSQGAAAEKLLRMNPNHALATSVIMEAFRKGGMELSGKNAITILYTALKRNPRIERVSGKAWGLSEWYPGTRKKLSKIDRLDEAAGAGPTTMTKLIKQIDDEFGHKM